MERENDKIVNKSENNAETDTVRATINERGQCTISQSNLVLESRTFSAGVGAREIHADGRPYHTFRTATLLVDGNNVKLHNCTIENTAGPGEVAGQAIALYLDGDDLEVVDSVLKGNQDTLFLAPLPPKEYEKDGFLGPKQFTPRTRRTFLFRNCKIYGSVDFIFGGATAIFENCDFISTAPGYVFAPSTPGDVETGFVAKNCRFLHEENVPAESCYIARPWREFGKVKLENCFLDEHICKEGWNDWGKTEARKTIRFEEYDSYGPGACNEGRPEWVICR